MSSVVGTVMMEDSAAPGRAMLIDLQYSDGRRVLLSTLNHLPTALHSMVMAYAFIDFAMLPIRSMRSLTTPVAPLCARTNDVSAMAKTPTIVAGF